MSFFVSLSLNNLGFGGKWRYYYIYFVSRKKHIL